MPRKKYDDNKLKDEMVALRRQGFSYRQIARQLGCSIYKVYELLSPYERPNARLKQAVELAEQLDKLAAEAQALNARFANLHKRLAELNVDDLKAQVSKANAQLRQLNAQTFHVEEMLKNEARELRSQIQALKASSEAIGQRLSQLEVTVAENEKKTLNLQVWINALRDTLSVRAMDFEEKVAKLENAIQWIYRTSAQRVYTPKMGVFRQLLMNFGGKKPQKGRFSNSQNKNGSFGEHVSTSRPLFKPYQRFQNSNFI
jgi:predicted  nucleic acid-binding Zn-ribbon protein